MLSSYYGHAPHPTQPCDCQKPGDLGVTKSCRASKKASPVMAWAGLLDFEVPVLLSDAIGAGGFSFKLHYLGDPKSAATTGTAGHGFEYTQNVQITQSGRDLKFHTAQHTYEVFTHLSGGTYSSAGNNTASVLTRTGSGAAEEFTITAADGNVSRFWGINPAIATPGRLKSLTDRYGNTQVHNWGLVGGQGRLLSVTDSYGRTSSFEYYDSSQQHRLKQITDFWGRQTNFQYDSMGHLVAVVGPAVTRGANNNANTFPNGTAYVYQYDVNNPRPERRDDLIKIWYPNQVAPYLDATRTVNVPAVYTNATPRRQITYYNDPTDAYHYGKVQQVLESATGTGSTGNGAWGYMYINSGLPANKIDPHDPIVSRTIATDRNGNQVIYDFNASHMLVHQQVFATRGKNSLQASSWETWTKYNGHNLPVKIVHPEGNSEEYEYEDESNTIRFNGVPYAPRVGLLKSMSRKPGNSIGIPSRPGSNGQGQLTELYFYDPIFNQQCAMIEARGNPVDAKGAFFAPQNGGAAPTSQDRSRYATITYYDYQKDTAQTVQNDPDLQSQLGLTADQIGQLITFVSQQMNAPTNQGPLPAGFEMGIGDVNGEGTGAGTGINARHTGAVVQVKSPAVRQLAPNAYPQAVLADSPLAYWRLNETSGTVAADSSGDGHNGTYLSGATLGQPGPIAGDTSSASMRPTSNGADLGLKQVPAQFSLEGWVRLDSLQTYGVLLSSDRDCCQTMTGASIWGSFANGGPVFHLWNNSSTPAFAVSGPNLSAGAWHHIVGTYDGATATLYVDGVAVNSAAYAGWTGGTSTWDFFAGRLGYGAYLLQGLVAELAIYDYALPAARVLAHYQSGSGLQPWAWVEQQRVELYTSNAQGQTTTYTNPEGNLTVYVRYPENNPDGDYDVYNPDLSNKQYGRVKEIHVDADPSTVMTLVGSDGDMITFIGNKIPRTNTPGVYQNLTTTHQGTTGCTMCNYDPLGNILTTVDARGNLTKYDRNELGEVYRVTMPAPYGYQVETYYDANRNVIQVDTQDMVVQYTSNDPSDPNYAKFTPSGSGTTANVPMTAGSGGAVRPGWFSNLYTYDLLDNKVEEDIDATGSSPSSLVTAYAYDANQNLIKVTKPQGNTVEYDYDERDLQIATRTGYDPAHGQSGSVTVNAFDGNGNLMDSVGPAQRGTAAQSLSVVIDDAFNGSVNMTFTGDWLVQNTYDGFDRLVQGTDAIGNVAQNTYDPGDRTIKTQRFGTAGGPTPADRTGSQNVLLSSVATRFDEAGRAYETQQEVFLNTGISGTTPVHTVASGRTITHTGGGLAANSVTNSHTATATLTSGGSSYVLARQVFDRAGRLTVSADDNAARTTYTYDGADRQLSMTDALGNVVNNAYDPNGNLTATTRVERCTISSSIATESFGSLMLYDVMNRLVVRADQGADGTLSSNLSDPSTLFTLLGYDSRGNQTNLIDPKQNTTVLEYDGANRKLRDRQHLRTGGSGTNPIVSTVLTQTFYDGNSRQIKLVDNNGGTTQYGYDTLDRLSVLTFHDGSTRIYGYDAASDVISYTDENGSVTTGSFDPAGRKTALSIARAANVQGTTAQSFQYDGLGRQTFARDTVALAYTDAAFYFDSLGRVVEEDQSCGPWYQVLDDLFQRPNTTAGGAGTTTGAGNNWIDVQGNVYSIQNQQLQGVTDGVDPWKYFRDLLARPAAENAQDQRIVLTTPANWTANSDQWFAALRYNGNPASKTFYLLGQYLQQLYIWKVVNGVLTILAGPLTPSPVMNTAHAYQFDCQCVGVNPTTLTVTLTDLATGTQVGTLSTSDSEPALQGPGSFAIDINSNGPGQAVLFTRVSTYAGADVGHAYVTHDKWAGQPAAELTYPNGRQVTSGYDLLYRLNAVSETSGGTSIAAWQFFGSRTALLSLGNGLVCSNMNNAQTRSAIQLGQPTPAWGSIATDQLGYDGAARLIGKRYFNGTSVLVGFTSAYDKSSNKLFERPLHAESRAALYDAYDSMNRLLDYQRGVLASGGGSITTPIGLPGTNRQQSYNLDGLGNWSTTTITPEGGTAATQTRIHNKLNEVTQYGSTPVYYDQGNNAGTPPQEGNGNIIDEGTRLLAFDAFNRLTSVSRKSDNATLGRYTYDAGGRRVRKVVYNGGLSGTVANGITRYFHDAGQCVEEVNAATGSTVRQFVWGQYVDELVQMKTYAPTGSQPLPAGVYYLLSDLLYRSSALTDSTGAVVEAYDTDAYGNTIAYAGPGPDGQWFTDDDAATPQPACEYVFTGRQYDPETQVYFYRARYYHPYLGRFVSRDSIFYAGGINLYEFVRSQPTTRVDPAGNKGCCVSAEITFTPDPPIWTQYNAQVRDSTGKMVPGYRFGWGMGAKWTYTGDDKNLVLAYKETGELQMVVMPTKGKHIVTHVAGAYNNDAAIRNSGSFSAANGTATYTDAPGSTIEATFDGTLKIDLRNRYTVQAWCKCKGEADWTVKSAQWLLEGTAVVDMTGAAPQWGQPPPKMNPPKQVGKPKP